MEVILICVAVLLGMLVLRIRGGWPVSVTLVEYQHGVLFRSGYPVRDIGLGRHRVWAGIEKIMIVDTRPVHVNYENQAVALRGGAAIYSMSGTARVGEVRKALYAATNYNHVPEFVLLCSARSVLNECTAVELAANRDAVTEKIISRARPRLAGAGFELLSFRLTELSLTQHRAER